MQAPRRDSVDVLVIGGGIAGLTAAWHAAQYGLSVALAEGAIQFGGQVANIDHIAGFPASPGQSGVGLSTDLMDACREAGVQLVLEAAGKIEIQPQGFRIPFQGWAQRAGHVILATGGVPRKLGVPGEDRLEGRGISHCASCDGPLYRGKNVLVVGGGDAAMQEAVHLAAMAAQVSVLVRDTLRARRNWIDRAEACNNIVFEWDTEIVEIIGEGVVQSVRVRDTQSGDERMMDCDGIFPLIGTTPHTSLLPPGVDLAADGRVITDVALRSSLPRLYAVGAVRAGYDGQVLSAAAEGAAAARAIGLA